MMTRAILALAIVLAPLTAHAVAGAAGVTVDASAAAVPPDAGVPASSAPEAAPAPAPSSTVANPATSPVQAWDDIEEAKRTSWALLVWIVLVMLGKALAYGAIKLAGVPVVGKAAALLAKGKGAMIVAGVGAVGAAGYDALASGGTWVAALVASGAALGGVLHSTTRPKA